MHWLYFQGSIDPRSTRERCWCPLGYSHTEKESYDYDRKLAEAQAA